jgi:hypothetical protein
MRAFIELWRELWWQLRVQNARCRGNRAFRRGNRTGGRILRVGASGKGRGV